MTAKELYELLNRIPDQTNEDIVKLTRYAFYSPIFEDLDILHEPAGSEAQKIIELIEKDEHVKYFFHMYMKMKYIKPFQPSLEWCFDSDTAESSWDYLKSKLLQFLNEKQMEK